VLEPATKLVDGWPLEAICLHLEAVTFGDINRLLINVPPGFMKSLLVNVFWPAWEWGPMNMPHLRYLAFSYALHLTMRDNDKLVRLVSSPRYRELWGDRFDLSKTGAHKPENDHTGYKFATSIEGVGTGERGDRVVLDDPHNVIKIDSQGVMEKTIAFFRTSMSNRLNDMVRSAIIVVMQRLSETDVSGNILEREANYCHLMVPMEFESARYPVAQDGTTVLYEGNEIGWIDPRALDDEGHLVSAQELAERDGELAWPERFPQSVIDNEIKTEMGPMSWSGQYQQSPVNLKGGIFQRDWWVPYEVPDEGPRAGKFPDLEYVVVSVDPAFTEKEENDPTGCTTWGLFYDEDELPRLILLAAWRKHLQIHGAEQPAQGVGESAAKYQARCLPHWGLVEMVAYAASRFGGADVVLVEAKASGLDVINELKRLYKDEKWGVLPIRPTKDKLARALAVQPTLAGGMVYAPINRDWAGLVITEMALFPKGRFKDLTDSATQAWKWMREQGLIRRPDEIVRQLEHEQSYEFVKSQRRKVLYQA
jgi:phage terminase large subunit-like protein